MPMFPGMGYPLVPGYESVGRVVESGSKSGRRAGQYVFVPGARCFGEVRGLFGGAASRLVVPGNRTLVIDERLAELGALLALAATAHNAIRAPEGGYRAPELIVGHGVLGRLLARLSAFVADKPPVVWEIDPRRRLGQYDYPVIAPDSDPEYGYQTICDVSGAHGLLDTLIGRLAPAGEVVLAGFYQHPLQFSFPPAFMRQARLRVAAEWKDSDLTEVYRLVENDQLSLDGLLTHSQPVHHAQAAYQTAFSDPDCLKMVLDWRSAANKTGI
ncbi:MAG TPA: chlorophyll synthesis pathway protein BchC, partial [Wenzhouxiangella sp.]|nr:chlorophyll synthesis pathway protein BchC [Wenzhouxiangella sp.]